MTIKKQKKSSTESTNAHIVTLYIYVSGFSVNGGWSSWSSWTSCSKSCGSGTQSASRSCSNPYPSNGGTGCSGSAGTSRYCNTHICPGLYISLNWMHN